MSADRPPRQPPADAEALVRTISASKIDSWSRCQAYWKYVYVDCLPFPTTPAKAFGSACDDTFSAGYMAKRDTGGNPKPSDSRERFAAALDTHTADVEDWHGEKKGELRDQGAKIVGLWAKDVAPAVRPLDVQRDFAVEVLDWRVNGRVDLTMELERQDDAPPPLRGRFVVDHKTTAKSWSAQKAGEQIQSVVYSLAARSGQLAEGVDPSRVGYEVMVRTKTPKRQRFVVGVGPADHSYLLSRVDLLRRLWRVAYTAGAFPPNRESWMCSRRNCPFWATCERENGGRVRD